MRRCRWKGRRQPERRDSASAGACDPIGRRHVNALVIFWWQNRKEGFSQIRAQMDTEHADAARLNVLSGQVIGCAFTVMNALGVGFLEKIYENALAHELRKVGLKVAQQHGMTVLYDGVKLGEYVVDMLVEDELLIELKVAKALDDSHRLQCVNYLKATGLQLCLLLNFGKSRLEIKRLAHNL
jgi:GxxExxY protein